VKKVGNPPIVFVNRGEDVGALVREVHLNNLGEENNIANLVETILAQNDLNLGLHRPNFV
jgi:hypothetical protein